MTFIRTFHPVGQGAFYTERYLLKGDEFTIVYDCGSTTLKGKELERKIKSTFPKNHNIDILFISHFHADHINGIDVLAEHCKIKKVVLPLIEDTAKTLLKVTNLIDNDYSDTSLIDSPEDFFGDDIPIIKIKTNEINLNSDGNELNLDGAIDISTIGGSDEKLSGTVFKLNKDIDWLFIPFNYEYNKRKEQFEEALGKYGLKLSEIDTINKIKRNKSNIIKAYNEVDGDLNKNSMILFSGKNAEDYIHCFKHFHYYHHSHFQSGCLYMGDIDLNEPDIVRDINLKFKSLLSFIGTLQVPHHGSVRNFASSILSENIRCAIFSYGITNTYGHPSDRVIGEVLAKDIYPHLVTEEQTSMVTQWKIFR